MLQTVTSSQSSIPTAYVGNGAVTSSDDYWNKVDSTNMLQNIMLPEWSQPPLSANNVSGEHHVTGSKINVISNEIMHPPNYTNISYPTNNVQNGYTTLHPTSGIGINTQMVSEQNRQMLGGYVWSNQSVPGRFVSQPPVYRPPGNKTTGIKKQKRIRTAFTTQQMMELEQEYARARYLDRARRIELADILRLNERTIKIWFQNRRMKEKKDKAEAMYESEEAVTSESSPEMGNFPMLVPEQYSGFQTDVNNRDHFYMEQYLDMLAPVSMPATSYPTSMSASRYSSSMLAMSFPSSIPAASSLTLMPADSSPTTISAIRLPTTMSAVSLATSMSAVSLATSMPESNSSTSIRATSTPISMPASCQSPSTEISELQTTESPEMNPQEVSVPVSSSAFFKKSWDLSYVRSLGFDF